MIGLAGNMVIHKPKNQVKSKKWKDLKVKLRLPNDSLGSYYASRRAPAIVNCNGSDREIGRVFAEYKDRLLVIGENKKEHIYLIPKSRIDRFGDNQVYFNVTLSSLKEFEF